ncbi:MAG: trimethylamine methyltransferase family protein, partial [Candidatus Adiutricales bacterium]
MALKGYYCHRPIELLTRDEKETIHEKSLEILKNTGAVFQWEPALTLLKEAGCYVDFESKRVKFSRDVVEEAINSCPSKFTVIARDSRYNLEIEPNKIYFTNQSAPFLYDADTNPRRPGTAND